MKNQTKKPGCAKPMVDKESKNSDIWENPVIFRTNPVMFQIHTIIFITSFDRNWDINRQKRTGIDRAGQKCTETDKKHTGTHRNRQLHSETY